MFVAKEFSLLQCETVYRTIKQMIDSEVVTGLGQGITVSASEILKRIGDTDIVECVSAYRFELDDGSRFAQVAYFVTNDAVYKFHIWCIDVEEYTKLGITEYKTIDWDNPDLKVIVDKFSIVEIDDHGAATAILTFLCTGVVKRSFD